jgi:hypothetical protein
MTGLSRIAKLTFYGHGSNKRPAGALSCRAAVSPLKRGSSILSVLAQGRNFLPQRPGSRVDGARSVV